jgi:hypothetical protein
MDARFNCGQHRWPVVERVLAWLNLGSIGYGKWFCGDAGKRKRRKVELWRKEVVLCC